MAPIIKDKKNMLNESALQPNTIQKKGGGGMDPQNITYMGLKAEQNWTQNVGSLKLRFACIKLK